MRSTRRAAALTLRFQGFCSLISTSTIIAIAFYPSYLCRLRLRGVCIYIHIMYICIQTFSRQGTYMYPPPHMPYMYPPPQYTIQTFSRQGTYNTYTYTYICIHAYTHIYIKVYLTKHIVGFSVQPATARAPERPLAEEGLFFCSNHL